MTLLSMLRNCAHLSNVVLLFSAVLSLPTVVGNGGFDFSQQFAIVSIVILSVILGKCILRACHLDCVPLPTYLLQLVTGFIALSILLLILISALNINVTLAGAISSVITAFLLVIKIRSWLVLNAPHHLDISVKNREWIDYVAIVLTSVLVTVWTREALASARIAQASGTFRAWSDFFLQASELRYLENYPSFAGNTMYLSGVPQLFYHRASYAASSLFSALSGTPPLETTMYFWMPSGIIFLFVGAYLLGCALGGRRAGLASIVILLLTPDPAMYWKNNSLFSFHWLVQVAPGTGYALGATLTGFAFYVLGVRQKKSQLIVGGAAFVVVSAFFRMHIAIPAIVTYGCLMLFLWRPTKPWYRVALFAGVAFVTALVIILAEQIPLAPHFISGKKDGIQYVNIILGVLPAGYTKLQQAWVSLENSSIKGLLGYLAILPLELGFFFPLMAVSLVIALRMQMVTQLWSFPLVLIVVHYALTIYMPTPMHGDISDWSHRSFPLIYSVVVVFTVSFLWNRYAEMLEEARPKIVKSITALFCIILTSVMAYVPWYFGKNIQKGFIGEGKSATSTNIPEGIFAVSQFIYKESFPGDVFVFSGGDPLAVIVSLTGLQAYISREAFYEKLGGYYAGIVKSRLVEVKSIATIEDIVDFGLKRGVNWFILQQSDNPKLFYNLSGYSELTVKGVSVFDLRKLQNKISSKQI